MTQHTDLNAPFPNTVFIYINHLGLSCRKRRNAKINFLRNLLSDCSLLGVEEIHCSPAVAQDLFLDHFHDHVVLYNVHESKSG